MALELRRLGIEKVHPLEGGWHGWKEKGYAMESPAHVTVIASAQ